MLTGNPVSIISGSEVRAETGKTWSLPKKAFLENFEVVGPPGINVVLHDDL
jgi:hypothetical protein